MPNQKNNEYSWFPGKRQENIDLRGLDFVEYAPLIFADPNVAVELDERKEYGEERFLAYGMADGLRLCLCFSIRDGLIHLITIFKVHEKIWEKHYGKDD